VVLVMGLLWSWSGDCCGPGRGTVVVLVRGLLWSWSGDCCSPGLLWSWSYGSWIYTTKVAVHGEVYSDTTLCEKVFMWLATGRWFSQGTSVSSTNKLTTMI
jgi:hypothetical protein